MEYFHAVLTLCCYLTSFLRVILVVCSALSSSVSPTVISLVTWFAALQFYCLFLAFNCQFQLLHLSNLYLSSLISKLFASNHPFLLNDMVYLATALAYNSGFYAQSVCIIISYM